MKETLQERIRRKAKLQHFVDIAKSGDMNKLRTLAGGLLAYCRQVERANKKRKAQNTLDHNFIELIKIVDPETYKKAREMSKELKLKYTCNECKKEMFTLKEVEEHSLNFKHYLYRKETGELLGIL